MLFWSVVHAFNMVVGLCFIMGPISLLLWSKVFRDISVVTYRSLHHYEDEHKSGQIVNNSRTMRRRRTVEQQNSSASRPTRTLHDMENYSTYWSGSSCPSFAEGGVGEDSIGVTLAVQTSQDRAWILIETCKRWRDQPIVAVVSVAPLRLAEQQPQQPSNVEEVGDDWRLRLEKSCHQLTLIEYELDEDQVAPELYPINKMRNVALDAVRTSHVLMVDVDFVPSLGLDQKIRNVLIEQEQQQRHQKSLEFQQSNATVNDTQYEKQVGEHHLQQQQAMVVPAFERLVQPCGDGSSPRGNPNGMPTSRRCSDPCLNASDYHEDGMEGECNTLKRELMWNCSQNNPCNTSATQPSSLLPRTFEELRKCVLYDRECSVFQRDVKVKGHSSTRSDAWLDRMWYETGTGTSNATIKTIPCFHR